jgi:hypothetical protein
MRQKFSQLQLPHSYWFYEAMHMSVSALRKYCTWSIYLDAPKQNMLYYPYFARMYVLILPNSAKISWGESEGRRAFGRERGKLSHILPLTLCLHHCFEFFIGWGGGGGGGCPERMSLPTINSLNWCWLLLKFKTLFVYGHLIKPIY